jgi:hypothetical protein
MRTNITKRLFAGLAATAVVVSMAACTVPEDNQDGTYASRSVKKNGTKAKSASKQAAQKEAPAYTPSQENAIASAQDYLDYSAFSRVGLIGQLSSKAGEGFPKADAIFAVNHIKVDWNQQAAAAAKDYLDFSAFSRTGLIQQLESKAGDGFTHAQAVYGVNQAGL